MNCVAGDHIPDTHLGSDDVILDIISHFTIQFNQVYFTNLECEANLII